MLILFPAGSGIIDLHIVYGKLVYKAKNNFLLRARSYFVDDEFITAPTDSTQVKERIQEINDNLKGRIPKARIYLIETHRGTFDTIKLAGYLSDKIAGEIHTSWLCGGWQERQYQLRAGAVYNLETTM